MMWKILVVDDDADHLETMVTHLDFSGHEAIPATSGEEAVALAEKERPDIVVMDIYMPNGIDGYEATRRILVNPKTSDIPVIAASHHTDEEVKERALAAGCLRFHRKRQGLSELEAKIQEVMAERQHGTA